ncbi:MAG: hypothetical protein AB7O57_19070 [Hyphomicrobiaceae bacterium]
MSTNTNTNTNARPVLTGAVIEAAIQRGRRERSQAFWTMLQAIFGRPENRESAEHGHNAVAHGTAAAH